MRDAEVRGVFAQSGLKWMVRQIFPPRYIFAVFPSSSGSSISNGVAGYVTGTSNCRSNSYRMSSWTYQHFPLHFVPSLLLEMVNQSLSFALLLWTYPMSAWVLLLQAVRPRLAVPRAGLDGQKRDLLDRRERVAVPRLHRERARGERGWARVK